MLINPRIITFLTLAETLNYTHTAKRLNLSQPAVTKHIQALEDELDTKLIIYENKHVHLTEKGKELIPYLTSLVRLNRMTTEMFRDKEEQAQVHLGVCLTLGNYYIHKIIESFYEAYPKVKLVVYVENNKKRETMLFNNELDVAISLGPTTQLNLNTKTLKEQEMVFIASKGHPLLNETIFIEDLMDKKIYLREEGSGVRDVFMLHLIKFGLSLEDFNEIRTVGSNELVKQLITQGDGIAPIYRISAKDELNSGALQILPINDLKMSYPITILTPKNTAVSGTTQLLINYLVKFIDEIL